MSAEKITQISGRAVPLRKDDIDTDRIIPARYLRCVTFDGLGEHAFEDDRQQNPEHPFNQARHQGASILIAGRNFGCGSSREHAPQSLKRWGIKAIAGQSFAEIFFGNCTNLGIPCVTLAPDDADALMLAVEENPALELTLDVETGRISGDGIQIQGALSEGARNALVSGEWNMTRQLLAAEADIEAVAASLPYRNDFR